MNRIGVSLIAVAGLLSAGVLSAQAADPTAQVRPSDVQVQTKDETYTLNRIIRLADSQGTPVVVLEPTSSGDGFGRISVDRVTELGQTILRACPSGTQCKLNVSMTNGTLAHVYSARQVSATQSTGMSGSSSSSTATSGQNTGMTSSSGMAATSGQSRDMTGSSTMPAAVSGQPDLAGKMEGRVRETKVDGKNVLVIESMTTGGEPTRINLAADSDLAKEILAMCPEGSRCVFEVAGSGGDLMVTSVERIRSSQSAMSGRSSLASSYTSTPVRHVKPAPVRNPKNMYPVPRGTYGPDDQLALPQIEGTSYSRDHNTLNRSAQEYPTLDYYRRNPATPSCPIYARPSQELTLPQVTGDCVR